MYLISIVFVLFAILHLVAGSVLLVFGLMGQVIDFWPVVHRYMVFGMLFTGCAMLMYNQTLILERLKLLESK